MYHLVILQTILTGLLYTWAVCGGPADDCLQMPQTAHVCSEHGHLGCNVSLTYLQNSIQNS